MPLTHTFIATLRAHEARQEIRKMAEFARRSLGQSIRRALERIRREVDHEREK